MKDVYVSSASCGFSCTIPPVFWLQPFLKKMCTKEIASRRPQQDSGHV